LPQRKISGRNPAGEENKVSFVPSDTIKNGLKKYGIGAKLRHLRLNKSMGLLELSKHSGLSPALLSKIERDLMHPTLATLLRIAMVFSVDLGFFFETERKPVLSIVRKAERLRFPEAPEAAVPMYFFESLDFTASKRVLNSYLADFEPINEAQVRTHKHPGIELLYVLSGKLSMRIGEEHCDLSEGDAIYFDSSVPHSYRRISAKRTRALVVAVGDQ
jgi:transcriptional regulator with XRE-family HTH domain